MGKITIPPEADKSAPPIHPAKVLSAMKEKKWGRGGLVTQGCAVLTLGWGCVAPLGLAVRSA